MIGYLLHQQEVSPLIFLCPSINMRYVHAQTFFYILTLINRMFENILPQTLLREFTLIQHVSYLHVSKNLYTCLILYHFFI